jgi:hypothetical protein
MFAVIKCPREFSKYTYFEQGNLHIFITYRKMKWKLLLYTELPGMVH